MSGGPATYSMRAPTARLWPVKVSKCFNNGLQSLFFRTGWAVASQPFFFLTVSLLLSTLSIGVTQLRFAQRLQDGFTASDAPSRREQAVKTEFDGQEELNIQRFVALIRRRDNGSLLGKEFLDQVFQVENFLSEKITVNVDGHSYNHASICGEHCDSNQLLRTFKVTFDALLKGEDVFLDHPQSRYHQFTFLVAHHLLGISRKFPLEEQEDVSKNVVIQKRDLSQLSDIDVMQSNKSALSGVQLITLYFQAPLTNANLTNIVTHWESEVFQWSQIQNEFPHLRIDIMGDKVLGLEMVRGGLNLLPHLICGLGLTVVFVSFSVVLSSYNTGMCDFGRVLIILGIVISPLLAVFSTFGILGMAGIEIYPMQMVIPFLILAIGVDDAFLMLHAWNRLLPDIEHLKGDRMKKVIPELFAKVLGEIGPSITLTSLTNALAFGIGTALSIPAIQLFCMAACLAMILDFIFEITIFGSLLSLSARFHQSTTGSLAKPSKTFSHLLTFYSEWLTKTSTRVVVVSVTVVFFTISIIGACRIETRINSQKIIPNDSPLLETDRMFKDYFWREYEPVQIFVNAPPNIGSKDGMEMLMEMVKEFESLPRAIGEKSTMLWLNDYKKMNEPLYTLYKLLGSDFQLDYQEVPHFLLHTKAGLLWNKTVKWHEDENGKIVVDAFSFYTGFHNATTWIQRSENMLHWRAVAERWSRYNVTVFSENSPVFEGIFGLRWTTYQTAGCTLLSMLLVCVLFIPSIMGVLSAAFAISSISIGVFGFLSWWGLDLDPVTMSAIVMSIGFSVDYTAHVSYHFQRAHSVLPCNSKPSDYVCYTVGSVGWPMIEAACSTFVCFLPVIFHPDYTPTVFVRTIILVVGWGVMHGLIILPTVLSMIPKEYFMTDVSLLYKQPVPTIFESKDPSDSCPESGGLLKGDNSTSSTLFTETTSLTL